MIKAVGAALMVVACGGIGLQVAKAYRDRPRQLAELANGIRMLRSEIEYSLTPLPQALKGVAARTSAPIGLFFAVAAERLALGDTALQAFEVSVTTNRPKSALHRDDLDVLTEFASTLGQSDLAHQSQQLDHALSRLAALQREARGLQQRNERMWQYLGILTGLLLVVILY